MPMPVPQNEQERLEALRRLNILDTPHEDLFDDLARMAAYVCSAPIAMVNLVDTHRVWAKSNLGFPASEVRRAVSPCSLAVTRSDVYMVGDMATDARYADNPFVRGGPRVRFYAGAPLRTADGLGVGTICVMDRIPRALGPGQPEALRVLARQVMSLLDLRRRLAETERSLLERSRVSVNDREDVVTALLEQTPVAVWAVDTGLSLTARAGAGLTALNVRADVRPGMSLFEFFKTDDPLFPPIAAHLSALRGEVPQPMRWSGGGRVVEVHVAPLRERDGRVVGAIGVAVDVSDRARLEAAMGQAASNLGELLTRLNATVDLDAPQGPPAPVGQAPRAPAVGPLPRARAV